MQSTQCLWQYIGSKCGLLLGIAINLNRQQLAPKSFDLKSIPTLFNLAAAACLWQYKGQQVRLGIAINLTIFDN